MAAPKAPVLDLSGKKAKDVTLAEVVFAAEIKPHLVHEAVRAEAAAARSGTRAAKSRGDGLRRPLEAVAPEGHRPRPRGHDPGAPVDRRRRRLRQAARAAST